MRVDDALNVIFRRERSARARARRWCAWITGAGGANARREMGRKWPGSASGVGTATDGTEWNEVNIS